MFNKFFFYKKFFDLTGIEFKPSKKYDDALDIYLSNFSKEDFILEKELKDKLLKIINLKLDLYYDEYRYIIDNMAKKNIIFNYIEKNKIYEILNDPNDSILNFFIARNIEFSFLDLNKLEKKVNSFTELKKNIETDKNGLSILESIFSAFIFHSIDQNKVYEFNSKCKGNYNSYFDFLKSNFQNLISRNKGLVIFDFSDISLEQIQVGKIFNLIEKEVSSLDNHSYICFIFKNNSQKFWEGISDITFFCEKYNEIKLDYKFYSKNKVFSETKSTIPQVSLEQFDKVNIGLHFKDNFLIKNKQGGVEYSVLLFEKNYFDEQKLPCPSCRSLDIQGNSFPKLGVRSWECKNLFCNGKSKYNRGKRYSLSAVLRQESINDEKNSIDYSILKKWRRDIVFNVNKKDIFEYIIKSYSIFGDNVFYYGNDVVYPFGRKISKLDLLFEGSSQFNIFDNNFVNKFLFKKQKEEFLKVEVSSEFNLINSDAFKVLSNIQDNFFDGAVTSPPYYNARDYSLWNNIFCYLYDMYNIADQAFRTLKDGSVFLYNIFDYFDNENDVVFSDMGKKRIILSSYASIIFRHVGFKYVHCIAWDKGEIQGNRNFNQGNNYPFYQAPHNCWEHILVFQKGEKSDFCFPDILEVGPVIKMIKGKNTYGHTAPYPRDIPDLLLNQLNIGSIVMDPFSGSGTTGRSAYKKGIKSVNIELHKEYCDLCRELLIEDDGNNQISLF